MVNTLLEMVDLFQANKIGYCLIGGLAIMLYQGRASTVDIDFYVLVEDLEIVAKLLKKNKYSVKSAGEYQLKAKIGKVPIDLLYADHYVGIDVVKRAIEMKLGDRFVKVATPEDLIVLKTMANRSVDLRDIEELREIYKGKLDEVYIQKKLDQVGKLLSP